MKNFDINRLRIASPCHIGWENMSGDERVRFCQSCQLNVFNISEMTIGEVNDLITKTEGRICGRIYKRTDGTVLTKDCPVGLRSVRKQVAKLAGAVFASIISLVSLGFGQEKKDKKDHPKTGVGNLVRNQILSEISLIKGVLTDETGAVIPNAVISIIDLEIKKEVSVQTDEKGEYKFPAVKSGKYKILFNAAGFPLSRLTDLSIGKNEMIVLNVRLEVRETVVMGIFVNENEPFIDTSASTPTYTIRIGD